MTPVVVCYFPGAGGVRLVNHLAGLNYRTGTSRSFHQNQHPRRRERELARMIHMPGTDTPVYATWDSVIKVPNQYAITCTHCMNIDMVRHHYPGRKIVKIKSNLLTSLARCWNLETQHQHRASIEIEGTRAIAVSNARVHWDYYTRTGVDWSADQVYDIEHDTDEFSVFMRELMPATVSQEYLTIMDQQPELKAALTAF